MRNSTQYTGPVRSDEFGYSVLAVQEEKTESHSGKKRGLVDFSHIKRTFDGIVDAVFLYELLPYCDFDTLHAVACTSCFYKSITNDFMRCSIINEREFFGSMGKNNESESNESESNESENNESESNESENNESKKEGQWADVKKTKLRYKNLMTIVDFLGAKEKAVLSKTNKAWRRMIMDPRTTNTFKRIQIVVDRADRIENVSLIPIHDAGTHFQAKELPDLRKNIISANGSWSQIRQQYLDSRRSARCQNMKTAFSEPLFWVISIVGIVSAAEGWDTTLTVLSFIVGALPLFLRHGGCVMHLVKYLLCSCNSEDLNTAVSADPLLASLSALFSQCRDTEENEEDIDLELGLPSSGSPEVDGDDEKLELLEARGVGSYGSTCNLGSE